MTSSVFSHTSDVMLNHAEYRDVSLREVSKTKYVGMKDIYIFFTEIKMAQTIYNCKQNSKTSSVTHV